MKGPRPKPLKERFLNMCGDPDDCGCVHWKGSRLPRGYGKIGRGGKGMGMALAHRVAYELFIGEIPKGMQVCHKCDVPSCVNPDHLFIGTGQENMNDMVSKGRSNRGSNHGMAKLTELDAQEIRRLRTEERLPLEEIGLRFNVSIANVSMIANKKAWGHI